MATLALINALLIIVAAHSEQYQGIGVALSGGGTEAVLAGLCNLASIDSMKGDRNRSTVVLGTSSGGTLAALLHANIGTKGLHFSTGSQVPSQLTMQNLNQSSAGIDGRPWWASILNEIPKGITARALLEAFGAGTHGRDWWPSLLVSALTKAYGRKDWTSAGSSPFYAQTAVVPDTAELPLHVNPRNGTTPLQNASHILLPAEVNMSSGSLWVQGSKKLNLSLVEAASASSAFWAGLLLADEEDGKIKRGIKLFPKELLLMKAGAMYLGDGGLIEATGIVPLIRHSLKKIIVFVNVPKALEEAPATLSFLFGVSGISGYGKWPGKALLHILPSEAWAEVYKNLTGPTVTAQLRNVQVLDNTYLGVESYMLEELLILGNQRSEAFLQLLPDRNAVVNAISKDWPLGMAVGMSAIEANLLCGFNQWKVNQNEAVIRDMLGPDSGRG